MKIIKKNSYACIRSVQFKMKLQCIFLTLVNFCCRNKMGHLVILFGYSALRNIFWFKRLTGESDGITRKNTTNYQKKLYNLLTFVIVVTIPCAERIPNDWHKRNFHLMQFTYTHFDLTV